MNKTKLENKQKEQQTKIISKRPYVLLISSLIIIVLSLYFSAFNNSKFSISTVLFSTGNLANKKAEENNNMAAASDESWKNAKTIYEFKAKDIDGKEVDLSKYKLLSRTISKL